MSDSGTKLHPQYSTILKKSLNAGPTQKEGAGERKEVLRWRGAPGEGGVGAREGSGAGAGPMGGARGCGRGLQGPGWDSGPSLRPPGLL